ncbi:MAG: alpha/beta hydrolase [Candidatus Cloacimonetes bacterium]|nr:alpha/beta hydrolase [Candidatus Cloacimonadota bacterium]
MRFIKNVPILIGLCFIILTAFAESKILLNQGIEYSIEDFPTAIDSLAQVIQDNPKYDNLIFFIHGHGNHPQKAIKKRVPELEKDYSAKVILFHWPTWEKSKIYPDEEAIQAGKDLIKIFKDLKKFKEENPETYKSINPSLLIHSMGNIVFKTFVETSNRKEFANLFNTILLNAADVDTENHHKWVDKISESDNIYITINNNDPVLHSSAKAINNKIRLGQKLKSMFNGEYTLSKKAVYLDLSQTGVLHKYYMKKKHKGNESLKYFYEQVLNGEKVKLTEKHGIHKVEGKPVYFIK